MMLARVKYYFKPLVEEILDQLPPHVFQSRTTTFLDPALGGGQFLREVVTRLRAAGHSDDNIRSRIWGCEITHMRLKYAEIKGGVLSDHLIKTDFLSHDWGNMKFDVILGNPPYQLTNSKKIWPDFINKSLVLLKDHGYLGMVVPSTWLLSDGAAYKRIRTQLTTANDLQVVSRDASKYFDVGQDICYLISQNKPYEGDTIYTRNGSTTHIDLRQGIPKSAQEQEIDQILDVMLQREPKIWWQLNERDDCIKSSDLNPTKNAKFKYQVYQSTANVGWVSHSPPDYGKLKLAVNFSSSFYSAVNDDHNMPITTHGVGSLMGYVLIKSKKQGEQMRSYLCSKAVRFLVNNYKKAHTGFNTAVKRRMIPQVPDKVWTDAQVYEYFGFTTDQIALIESMVK